MNYEPIEILHFQRFVDGSEHRCVLERFEDGSVGVSGDQIDTWMFEFSPKALEQAIAKIESLGFSRVAGRLIGKD